MWISSTCILSLSRWPSQLKSSRSTQLVSFLIIILNLTSISTLQSHRTQQQQQPQPRSYDSFAYYVLETRSDHSSQDTAQNLASALDTEFVERVGELDDFWLVRAPKDLVTQGYELDSRSAQLKNYYRRGIEDQAERDAVMERYDLIRRSVQDPQLESEIEQFDQKIRQKRSLPPPVKLSARQIVVSVRSLERQILRKRHKRSAIYVPSEDGLSPIVARQVNFRPTKGGKLLSLSQQVARKFNIFDPLWPKQWHLVNDQMPQHMVNATGLWAMGITGKNVTVAIVDDGLDMTSDDLKDNFFEAGSWDYNDHTPLPEPRLPDDLHGTRCAGEIAAIRNNVCGVGVAFDAKVSGIRILSASISDADEASALNYGYQENHVYSCSWGPPDDGKSMEAPSRLIFKAMLNGIQKGRGGKGSVFVFASGNGGAVDDQCNFDGYTNSIYSITVSAIDRQGLHPYYSEVCSANMVVTYSSGSGDNIHTTDVGKNKCTDRHGGTSAAAPLGAAIFALLLQARPDLTWRDVQYLAVATAIPFNLDDPDWQMTASGRLYNHKFGFGNLDAYRIVEAAKDWELVKPQAWWTSPNVNAHSQPVTREGTNATIVVTQRDLDASNFESLEHITVAVNIKHGRRGNVRVLLVSPHGSVSILATHRRYDDATTGFPGWVFMTVKHWGENPVGSWTLSVQDPHQQPGMNGTFEDWAMGLWGQCKDPTIQKLFKMPDDAEIILPPSPVSGVALETVMPSLTSALLGSPTPVGNPPPLALDTSMGFSKTKSIVKPTAHLPEDHAGDIFPSMGEVSSYFKPKSSWVYVAFGIAMVLAGCLCGWFFLIRARRRREQDGIQSVLKDDADQGVGLLSGSREPGLFKKIMGGASGRGNGYGLEPVAGEEDLPLRSMRGSGPFDSNDFNSGSKSRTKELYDAFGEGSEDGSSDDHDKRGEYPTRQGPYRDINPDDEYMESFLEDDVNTPRSPNRKDETDEKQDGN